MSVFRWVRHESSENRVRDDINCLFLIQQSQPVLQIGYRHTCIKCYECTKCGVWRITFSRILSGPYKPIKSGIEYGWLWGYMQKLHFEWRILTLKIYQKTFAVNDKKVWNNWNYEIAPINHKREKSLMEQNNIMGPLCHPKNLELFEASLKRLYRDCIYNTI